MAEAIGLIAGGINIATLMAQAISSTVKMRSYWNQIHNVPEDIQDLIEEVEIICKLLAKVEMKAAQTKEIISHREPGDISTACIEHCRRGVDHLEHLTARLSNELDAKSATKRRWAAAKVVLKRERVERYKTKLEQAIRLLSLSYQLHLTDLVEAQPDEITSRLIGYKASIAKSSGFELQSSRSKAWHLAGKHFRTVIFLFFGSLRLMGLFEYQKRSYPILRRMGSGKIRAEVNEEFVAWYHAPWWLTNRLWKIQAFRASCGDWTFCPRTFLVVPNDSMVFCYARVNDVKGLQGLFAKRKASPYDCSFNGFTPLHEAAASGNFAVCKLLIDVGADVDYKSQTYMTPIRVAKACIANAFCASKVKEASEVERLLSQEIDSDDYDAAAQISKEKLTFWERNISHSYYEQPLGWRVVIAVQLPLLPHVNHPERFREAIALGPIPVESLCATNYDGKTLLHAVAQSVCWVEMQLSRRKELDDEMGRIYMNMLEGSGRVVDMRAVKIDEFLGWLELLRELVSRGSDYHHVSDRYRTPLLDLLAERFVNAVNRDQAQVKFPLLHWFEQLQASGVDLMEYGKEEINLQMEGLVSWDFVGYEILEDETREEAHYMLSEFSYGYAPEDWCVRAVKQADPQRQPQRPVVPPSGKMPGGWVEE